MIFLICSTPHPVRGFPTGPYAAGFKGMTHCNTLAFEICGSTRSLATTFRCKPSGPYSWRWQRNAYLSRLSRAAHNRVFDLSALSSLSPLPCLLFRPRLPCRTVCVSAPCARDGRRPFCKFCHPGLYVWALCHGEFRVTIHSSSVSWLSPGHPCFLTAENPL